jgi:hypothetical protein
MRRSVPEKRSCVPMKFQGFAANLTVRYTDLWGAEIRIPAAFQTNSPQLPPAEVGTVSQSGLFY